MNMKQLVQVILSFFLHFGRQSLTYLKKHPQTSSILLLVCIWHIAIFQFLGVQLPKLEKVVNPPKPIAVQTVKLRPPPPKEKPKKPSPSKPSPKRPKPKQEKPKEKKSKPKPPSKNTPKKSPAKKAKPEKKEPSPQVDLLDDLREQLAAIEQRQGESYTAPKVQAIAPLESPKHQEVSPPPSTSMDLSDPADIWYREELIKRLKLNLKLPDAPSVHLRLKIRKDGQVADIEILASESKKNQSYVLQTLPTIPFPRFGPQMASYEFRVFPLVLESEG